MLSGQFWHNINQNYRELATGQLGLPTRGGTTGLGEEGRAEEKQEGGQEGRLEEQAWGSLLNEKWDHMNCNVPADFKNHDSTAFASCSRRNH